MTQTGSLSSTLGTHNPLRYRGYVYDTETQLYYLQSRYYNPEIGRFINADMFVSTGIIGGTFNTLSFATGLGATSNTIDGLFVKGMADLGENLVVGAGIGVSTSIATSVGTLDSPFAVQRDFKQRAVL